MGVYKLGGFLFSLFLLVFYLLTYLFDCLNTFNPYIPWAFLFPSISHTLLSAD